MKRYLLTILAVLGLVQWASAQQRKINAANEDTREWRYTIQNEAVGNENTALVCVHSYSKSVQVAREQCLRNAIHGLIFRGAPGKCDSLTKEELVKGLAPLVNDSSVEQQHSEFFRNLFRDGGEYRRYATVASSDGWGSVVRKKGRVYDVRVYVTVQYNELRRRLEQEGILVSMSEVAESLMPSVIVAPSDDWCIEHGYYTEVDLFGQKIKEVDYRAALQNVPDLSNIIVEIGSLMKERGLNLELLEDNLKQAERLIAEERARGMDGNGTVKKTVLEQMRQTVKADFWIKIYWSVKNLGPRAAVDLRMVGVDAYSNNQVAGAQGSGRYVPRSALNVPAQLRTTAAANIEQFNRQLLESFKDFRAKGHIVTIKCLCMDTSDCNLDTEVESDVYVADVIEDWVAKNAFNGVYAPVEDMSTNSMTFTEVRLPLKDSRGHTLSAARWIRGLKSELKNRYNIPAAIDVRGKGEIIVTLGAE